MGIKQDSNTKRIVDLLINYVSKYKISETFKGRLGKKTEIEPSS